MRLVALAVAAGIDPRIIMDAPLDEHWIWQRVIDEALRTQEKRDRNLAQTIANLVWAGIKTK